MRRRVVVTGMGAVCPLGLDVASSWEAALDGRSGITPITLFDATTFPTRIAGQVRGGLAARQRMSADGPAPSRSTVFLLEAAAQACEQAGLNGGRVAPERMGVAMGSHASLLDLPGMAALITGPNGNLRLCEIDMRDWSGRLSYAGSHHLARLYQAQGPNLTLTTACAAGAQALGQAVRIIQSGRAEVMIAGGHDAMVSEFPMLSFCLLRVLSTRNETPSRASRPFDRLRDGFVMGEGAAVLILEEREHARARGAEILAEVKGYGTAMSAYRITDSPPDGDGAWQAISLALDDAGLSPSEVDYINAHGTSTLDNDRTETEAVKRVFGEQAYRIPISSTKSMTGHLIGAAGALELVFTIMALRDNAVPPTINLEEPDPDCDLDYVPGEARQWPVRIAVSNSFGFGGHNATLIVGGAG